MRATLTAWRLACVLGLIVRGLCTCVFIFPWIAPAARMGHIQRWSLRVLRTFGVTVDVAGAAPVPGNLLLVANHVSWVDVFVINACLPSRFVAKSEVRRWPLIGSLAALAGTVFVTRGQRSSLRDTVATLAARLGAGERIACFPEGTSAAQGKLRPFNSNLFEAAIAAAVPVQALALSYLDDTGGWHASVEYIADMSLADSMLAILNGKPIRACVSAQQVLSTAGATRRTLALAAHGQVAAALASRMPPASGRDAALHEEIAS
ncbi:lysophospholipid acyltransferase family protein [Massilia sp. TWR1-2-2]|uniref:lysophospholipid acyltransferase family protein n=1 Tax=Massilia sp. TWR1-2-2 TaxID=2804584 RepID=UPI003CE8D530